MGEKDNMNDNSNIPIQVNGLDKVIAIAAGGYQSLALVQSPQIPPLTSSSTLPLNSTSVQTFTSTPIPTSTFTQTDSLIPALTSTTIQESLSTDGGIDSRGVLLIFGLIAVAVAGIVWFIRHKTNS